MRVKKSHYFLAIAVLPLLFLLQSPQFYEPIHDISYSVVKPFLILGDSIALTATNAKEFSGRFWRAFQNQTRYEETIRAMQGKLLHYDEIYKENERLRALLAFKESMPAKSVAARVIGWDISLWRKTVLLDKGSLQGIKKNMSVVVPHGLVGRVLEVNPGTSRVLLLIDPEARVGTIANDSRAQGVAAGNGASTLTLRYLDLESGLQVGETIITSGVSKIFPKGIGIGKIQSIQRDPDGLHLSASVVPFVEFSKLEEVLCLEFSQRE